MNIDEKDLEKNAILKALDWVNNHKPNLYCGSQCMEPNDSICERCKEKYKKDFIKWENKKQYWENKLKVLEGDNYE
jgi:hypothetical protein